MIVSILSDSDFNRHCLRAHIVEAGVNVPYCGTATSVSVQAGLRHGSRSFLLDVGAAAPCKVREACQRVVSAGARALAVCCAGPDPPVLSLLLEDGLTGYTSLAGATENLEKMLQAANEGETTFFFRQSKSLSTDRDKLREIFNASRIDEQDLAILDAMGTGARDLEIGRSLGLSEDRIRHHIARLMREHGVSTRFQLGAWARDRGLVAPSAGGH